MPEPIQTPQEEDIEIYEKYDDMPDYMKELSDLITPESRLMSDDNSKPKE
jgi:hypothetical protein